MVPTPLRSLVAAACLAAMPAMAQPVPACEAAGAAAEATYGVPAGLLVAIGRVESGRRDPLTGRVAPWPWAINAEGRGKLFESQDDAVAGTRAVQAAGVASIDVGCFQINLVSHRTAFATLADGFDPAHNADYAARFLLALRDRTGSWEQAVAHYHSATPERGLPYRDRVLAGWSRDGGAPTALVSAGAGAAVAAPATPLPPVVRSVNWVPPAGGGMRVWTPSAPGQGASVITILPGPVRTADAARAPRG